MPIDAHSVLCAQLTRDVLTIANFLYTIILTLDDPDKQLFQRMTFRGVPSLPCNISKKLSFPQQYTRYNVATTNQYGHVLRVYNELS